MDKLLKETIIQPHTVGDWYDVLKETDDTFIIAGKDNGIIIEHVHYTSLEDYLKENLALENISLESILSYYQKGEQDDFCDYFTIISVEKREIEVNFTYMGGAMRVLYQLSGSNPMSENEEKALKYAVIYKEKYLREESKNRLRYLQKNIKSNYCFDLEGLSTTP